MIDLELDFDIDTGGQVELHQRIDRLLGRLQDVEEALVGAHLELLPALLVNVRTAQNAVLVDHRRQGNRAGNAGSGAFRGVDDLSYNFV